MTKQLHWLSKTWRIALAVAVVVVLWAGCWVMVANIAPVLSVEQREGFGQVGDSFGAASSLFAGLGALAVVIVLIVDIRERRSDLDHRRNELRPFTMGNVRSTRIADGEWKGQHFSLAIELALAVSNAAEVPAINLGLVATLQSKSFTTAATVELSDAPLPPHLNDDAPAAPIAEVRFHMEGESAKGILEALAAGERLTVHTTLRYQALSGTPWATHVSYSLEARRADRPLLERVLDPESGEFIRSDGTEYGGVNVTPLDHASVPGSWRQVREDSRLQSER
jgi:hypothetical protein